MPVRSNVFISALGAVVITVTTAPFADASSTALPSSPDSSSVDLPGRSDVPYEIWQKDVQEVAHRASAYLHARTRSLKPSERAAIVLDIDNSALETAYADELPIPPVQAVLQVVVAARSNGVKIFFVTARTEIADAATKANLRHAGYPVDGLYSRPVTKALESPAEFKTAKRKEIERDGYTIVANIGNTVTDLVGGHAERAFKLPDYDGKLW
ncbi:HAD family acid phosphatase [Streptomyces sp. NPDC048479]|uniref:HAD family acid phosphatase n=1 Tax=Streptomyces sp. NPDC048479 TaxID=3154725 RepID=UPI0034451F48